MSKQVLRKLQTWGNVMLGRVFDRKWGTNLAEYRGESAKYFHRIRKEMGKGRQHLIHRAVEAYMKDLYKSHNLTDDLGNPSIRKLRDHKKLGSGKKSAR